MGLSSGSWVKHFVIKLRACGEIQSGIEKRFSVIRMYVSFNVAVSNGGWPTRRAYLESRKQNQHKNVCCLSLSPAHTMYTSIKHFKEQTFNSKVVKFWTSKGTRFFYWRHLVPNLSSHLPNITTPINSSHGFHELSKRLKTWCRHSQRHTYHFTEAMLIDRCLFKLTVVSYWFNVSTYLKRLYQSAMETEPMILNM